VSLEHVFAPHPGAAPLPRMVIAQAAMESRLLLRNGEQLLVALVIPLIALVGGVLAADAVDLELADHAVDVLTPGVVALAVMSTAFTSLAIATGFERRYGLIKRLGASPLPRSGLLLGKVVALLLVELCQLVVIGGVALAMGWRPAPGYLPGLLGALLVGSFGFASLGLLMAGLLRAEATLAAANLVYLLLLAGGAVLLPATTYGGMGELVRWLPSGALGEAMRRATLDGAFPALELLVLLAWGAVGTVLTARTFRWE
jgi:ABC-2 type transport system permease protein